MIAIVAAAVLVAHPGGVIRGAAENSDHCTRTKIKVRSKKETIKLLADLFFSFARISLFTVGGGVAMIPLVMDLAVKKKGWFSEEEMLECLTISQSLPGGIIVNMGSFIGKRLCGTLGMLMAAIGAVFPTATLAVIVGVFLGGLDDNVYALGAMQGAKAAAVAIVIITFFRLGTKTLNKSVQWIVAVIVIVLIIVLHVSPIWLILAGAGLGLLIYHVQRKRIVNDDKQKEDS